MSTTVKTGWLNDKNGDKFAPKTLISQVQTSDGVSLEAKYYTKEEVDQAIANAQFGEGEIELSNYYTKDETDAKIEEAISGIGPGDMSGYAKTEYVDAQVAEAKEEVLGSLNSHISANNTRVGAIEEKNNAQDLAITQLQGAVQTMDANKATQQYVDDAIASAITLALNTPV